MASITPPLSAAADRRDSRTAAPVPRARDLIDLKEVCRRTTLGRTTIWKLTREGTFPPAIKISANVTRWSAAAVDQWIEDRIAAATEPRR